MEILKEYLKEHWIDIICCAIGQILGFLIAWSMTKAIYP
jgi:hypothetical protein